MHFVRIRRHSPDSAKRNARRPTHTRTTSGTCLRASAPSRSSYCCSFRRSPRNEKRERLLLVLAAVRRAAALALAFILTFASVLVGLAAALTFALVLALARVLGRSFCVRRRMRAHFRERGSFARVGSRLRVSSTGAEQYARDRGGEQSLLLHSERSPSGVAYARTPGKLPGSKQVIAFDVK